MADNALIAGVPSIGAPSYPQYQPVQQVNPLAQIQAATQTAQGLQNLQASQVGLQQKKLDIIHNEMGALTSVPGGPSWQDVQDRISSLTQMGVLSPREAASALPNIPQGSGPEANLARKAFFDKQLQITGGYTGNMGAAYGGGIAYDNGVSRQYGVVNPRTPGNPQYGGGTVQPNYEPMNVPNASTGATDVTTRAGFGQNVGVLNGAITRGQQPNAQPSGQPTVPATGGQGAIPGVSPQLGVDRDAYNTDLATSKNLMTSIQPLKQALPLAERLANSPVGTGPGTKTENDVRSFLIAQKFIKPDENVDIRHELDKYLAQTVAGSPLSNRSDMGTLVAQASNPNTVTQTTPATIALIRNAIGQANLQAAAPLAFQGKNDTSGNMSPAGYQQHRAQFTQQQDVDAYKLDTLDPAARTALVQKMAALPVSDPRRTRFFQSLTNADKAKVISAPGQ